MCRERHTWFYPRGVGGGRKEGSLGLCLTLIPLPMPDPDPLSMDGCPSLASPRACPHGNAQCLRLELCPGCLLPTQR